MSKYVTYDCTTIRNLEILLAALARLGWDSGKVEVHNKPQALYGFAGDRRSQTAEVIIRRNRTGISSSNDIGFRWVADKPESSPPAVMKYWQANGAPTRPGYHLEPIVSDYDTTLCAYGRRGERFVDAVQREYGQVAGDKAISTVLNTSIPTMKAKGIIPRHATAKTVVQSGATKIVVTY